MKDFILLLLKDVSIRNHVLELIKFRIVKEIKLTVSSLKFIDVFHKIRFCRAIFKWLIIVFFKSVLTVQEAHLKALHRLLYNY